jgi:hypothetical protein
VLLELVDRIEERWNRGLTESLQRPLGGNQGPLPRDSRPECDSHYCRDFHYALTMSKRRMARSRRRPGPEESVPPGKPQSGGFYVDGPHGYKRPDVIDAILRSRDGSTAQLAIAQDIEWSGSPNIQRLIRGKLDAYLNYAQSLEFRGLMTREDIQKWIILVSSDDNLDATSHATLLEFRRRCRYSGGDLVINISSSRWSWE